MNDSQKPKGAPLPWWAKTLGIALWAVVLLMIGMRLGSSPSGDRSYDGSNAAMKESHEGHSEYTCSMHPQIRLPKPGKCPICHMDLIEATSGSSEGDGAARELKFSEAAIGLMDLQTAKVQRRAVTHELRMNGTLEIDETRKRSISAYVNGRIERMFVDYVGVPVREGDHLVTLYSPDLLVAQRELLEADKALRRHGRADDALGQSLEATFRAAWDKLRLWGLASWQIREALERGTPADQVTIFSPMSGIVLEKPLSEGDYVKTGTLIYSIVDLDRLWLMLDAYESDMEWIRFGQEAEFEVAARPGETFTGKIAFIAPTVDRKSRTVKVRVNVPNEDRKLKPGFYVRAVVRPRIGTEGAVYDPGLAGKWISPMHPEIVRDQPGPCPVCGMPLAPAEELGYVTDLEGEILPLTIPATAPLITGKRAVVYVRKPNASEPAFEGREIALGPRAGDLYLVESGLEEGEIVVSRGAFKIDSAMQIQAMPSMMNPDGGGSPPTHHHGSMGAGAHNPTGEMASGKTHPGMELPEGFADSWAKVLNAYLDLQEALAADQPDRSRTEAKKTQEAIHSADHGDLDGAAAEAWSRFAEAMEPALDRIAQAEDLQRMRAPFGDASQPMVELARQWGSFGSEDLHLAYCPMALSNQGAEWLQRKDEISNPYFGAMMLRCGEIRDRLDGGDER